MIERNKNIAGRTQVMLFGLVCIIDGLVRIFTLGYFHTRLPIEYAKKRMRTGFKNARKNLTKESDNVRKDYVKVK